MGIPQKIEGFDWLSPNGGVQISASLADSPVGRALSKPKNPVLQGLRGWERITSVSRIMWHRLPGGKAGLITLQSVAMVSNRFATDT